MQKKRVNKSEIKLIGITIKTNNRNESNPATAKISEIVERYWEQNIHMQIPNRKNPGVTFCAYTNYESDENGDYTYFVGEEVSSLKDVPAGLQPLVIPYSKYIMFTTAVGKMPQIVIDAWQQIWKMSPNDFGGQRTYIADFEIYDQRAIDPFNTSLDIYIGIN